MKKILLSQVFTLAFVCTFAQLAWLQMPDFPGTGKLAPASFSINNKGYMGMGQDNTGTKVSSWYEYDPAGNTWTAKASFPGAAKAVAVNFVINGKGYVTTGETNSGLNSSSQTWEYDPATNTWTQKANFPGGGRLSAAGFTINGKGYVGTGFVSGSVTNDFYEYDPATDTWTQKANFAGAARNGAVAFSIGSKGYLGMGSAFNSTAYYTDFYEYDPANNTWTQKADFPLPYMASAVTYNSGTEGYVLSGYYYQYSGITHNPMNMFYSYEPTADTWTLLGTFPGYPRGYAGGFSLTNDIYIGAGNRTNGSTSTNQYSDFWKLSNGITLMVDPGNSDSGFKIYPNPATDMLNVVSEMPGEQVASVRIYNTQGQLLVSNQMNSAASVDVSALPAGIFFVEAITTSGKVLDGKFVK